MEVFKLIDTLNILSAKPDKTGLKIYLAESNGQNTVYKPCYTKGVNLGGTGTVGSINLEINKGYPLTITLL